MRRITESRQTQVQGVKSNHLQQADSHRHTSKKNTTDLIIVSPIFPSPYTLYISNFIFYTSSIFETLSAFAFQNLFLSHLCRRALPGQFSPTHT